MKSGSLWIVKLVVTGMMALSCVGAVSLLDRWEGPGGAAPAGSAALDPAPAAPGPDVVLAVTRGDEPAGIQPAAICRIAPECWRNSDCDSQCGVGLGKCVHSNCPVRICRCR